MRKPLAWVSLARYSGLQEVCTASRRLAIRGVHPVTTARSSRNSGTSGLYQGHW